MKNFIPYAHQSVNEADIASVTEVLREGKLTRGLITEQFEEAIAAYCGASYAVAFNSATSALIAACHVAGVNSNDRVVTTPNTFVATTAAGWHSGAEPLFIDIDIATGNMDLELVQHNVNYRSSRGRNVYLPVHFSGIPVDMKRLDRMITDPNAIVIEDAAHALGSTYSNGSKVGSCEYSQMTVFSFHPAKIISTGEGGMVTTNDEELARLLRLFRNNGIERDPNRFSSSDSVNAFWYYEVKEITGNYHMTEIQAALGLSQLQRLDDFIAKRERLMEDYRHLLADLPGISFLHPPSGSKVAYALCVVLIDFAACGTTRIELMNKLYDRGIGTQLHYIPIYHHPFFAEKRKDIAAYFPKMEEYYAKALSLPLYYDLSTQDLERIVSTLKEFLVLSKNA